MRTNGWGVNRLFSRIIFPAASAPLRDALAVEAPNIHLLSGFDGQDSLACGE
jgi:hypothetical protein